jgi:hypothetical protein
MSVIHGIVPIFFILAVFYFVNVNPEKSPQPYVECNLKIDVNSCTACRLYNIKKDRSIKYIATLTQLEYMTKEVGNFSIFEVKSKLKSILSCKNLFLDEIFAINDLEPLTRYQIRVMEINVTNSQKSFLSNRWHFASAGPSSLCTAEHAPCACAKLLAEEQHKGWICAINVLLNLLTIIGVCRILACRR